MRLSIITVVKDDDAGLLETIRSVDEQVLGEVIEHLIIDSSSPVLAVEGASSEVISRRTAVMEPRGVYPAMNRGLELAAGEYVWFLNAGDTLTESTTMEKVLRLLDSSPGWVVGRIRIIERSGRAVESSRWDFADEKRHLFARGSFPPHQATITRTSLMRDLGGFDTRYQVAADYQAALKLARETEPLMTDAVLAEFREGGLSTSQWKVAQREFHQARRDVMAPRGVSGALEYWNTGIAFLQQFVHRSILRADR